MKYKKIIAALMALLCFSGAYSCGKDKPSEGDTKPEIIDSTDASDADVDATEEGTEELTDSGSSDKSQTTTTAKNGTNDPKVTVTTAKGQAAATAKHGGAVVTTKKSSGGSSNNNNSGNDKPAKTTQNSQKPTVTTAKPQQGTTTPAATDPTSAPDENVYTAEIILGNSPEISGANVTTSGSVVTVNAGGEYRFTGSVADGQICVNTVTEEKVTIVLDGVDIHNSTGPAIFINEAKKCTIKVREGSVNNLSDQSKNKALDGVIYSNDTLRFKGNGTLNITAGNAHGICSDDDIIVENGNINIKSKKSGMIANDDITISGGDIVIEGGTNGLKSKGTVHINGGHSVIAGGTKEEKCSIYAAGAFEYTDGWLFAAGNLVYTPTSSANPFIVATFSSAVDGGTTAEMILDGVQMISFAPHCSFRTLLMLAPEIGEGSTFSTVIGGNSSSDHKVKGTENIFEIN